MCHRETTSIYPHLAYVAMLHRNITESQLYIKQGLQLQLPYNMKSSFAYAHGSKFRGGNFKPF